MDTFLTYLSVNNYNLLPEGLSVFTFGNIFVNFSEDGNSCGEAFFVHCTWRDSSISCKYASRPILLFPKMAKSELVVEMPMTY